MHIDLGADSPINAINSADSAQNISMIHTHSHSAGQIFICPIASSLSRLKGLDEFKGDFIELDFGLTKDKILDFYTQDFYKACDYCHNMWEKKREIPVAIQTKEVLKLEK